MIIVVVFRAADLQIYPIVYYSSSRYVANLARDGDHKQNVKREEKKINLINRWASDK